MDAEQRPPTAIKARDEFDAILGRMLEARYEEFDVPLGTVALNRAIKGVERLKLILKPFPIIGAYKGIPFLTVQPRLWAGIITNPNGPWGTGSKLNRTKRSVYLTDEAKESMVETGDLPPWAC